MIGKAIRIGANSAPARITDLDNFSIYFDPLAAPQFVEIDLSSSPDSQKERKYRCLYRSLVQF